MATTTSEAAPAVRLNTDWREKYLRIAQQLESFPGPFSVCLVGRSGVGKSSLINHLLRQRAVRISPSDSDIQERAFDVHGRFVIREIPGYDGRHSAEPPSSRWRFFHCSNRNRNPSSNATADSSSEHSSNFSSGCSSGSNSYYTGSTRSRKLDVDEFVEVYGLFEEETKAIVFVVNDIITTDDKKLIQLAKDKGKFFFVIRTNADIILKNITDGSSQKVRLDESEQQLRRDLDLIGNLNARVFILCVPFPESHFEDLELRDGELQKVMNNIQNLHFPLLEAYLSRPKGLFDELQIHDFVKQEVWNALQPLHTVKKRHQALDFSQHLVAGTLIPIAGPVMVSFIKTLKHTLRACSSVGLIEDADDAIQKVRTAASKHALSAQIASKEGMVTAVHDTMVHIFGRIVFEIAIAEVVTTAAETTLHGALPLLGSAISATHLPSRYRKIAEKLANKACMLHELWIMQNITGLLGRG